MDTHTRSAQDLLPSSAQSYDADELEHEGATERPAHSPPQLHSEVLEPAGSRGHAEVDAEAASLPFSDDVEPAQPLTMPGEHEAAAVDPAFPTATAPAAKPSTRNVLLGTALAFTLMVGGGGIYVLSHRGHTVQMATMQMPAGHPEQATRNPAADPFQPPAHHTEQASGGDDDILALRHDSTSRPVAATTPVPKAAPPVVAVQVAPVVVAPPPPMAVAAPARPDPVATALAIRPAPMTPPQQVDVLSLVTQLAAIVRDMRTENAQLRDKVASLDDQVKNETSDVSQRLNLMEARKAIASAQDAGRPAPVLSGGGAGAPARVVQSVALLPVVARSVRDYRVQAASPGLAILSNADAAPGQSPGLQVSVGDQVPGVGRITRIAQRGTAWVVQTNHGDIQ